MTPWTVARQVPLSMEFSRQEYWSRLPFPSPGDCPDPGIKPESHISCIGWRVLYRLSHRKPHTYTKLYEKMNLELMGTGDQFQYRFVREGLLRNCHLNSDLMDKGELAGLGRAFRAEQTACVEPWGVHK